MIILDLKEKDLYSSWEESMFESISDYKNTQVIKFHYTQNLKGLI